MRSFIRPSIFPFHIPLREQDLTSDLHDHNTCLRGTSALISSYDECERVCVCVSWVLWTFSKSTLFDPCMFPRQRKTLFSSFILWVCVSRWLSAFSFILCHEMRFLCDQIFHTRFAAVRLISKLSACAVIKRICSFWFHFDVWKKKCQETPTQLLSWPKVALNETRELFSKTGKRHVCGLECCHGLLIMFFRK